MNPLAAAAPPTKRPPLTAWAPENLPPFPAVALKALKVMAGTDTSLLQLCDIIRQDAVFSAEILRIANSPLIAFPSEIKSVVQASMLLGFVRLKRLVMTVGLRAYVSTSLTFAHACWRHSVACAMVAERTGKGISSDLDFAYTAGILHDIGRVALVAMHPQPYADLLSRAVDGPIDLLRREQEAFGVDHCQAGHALAIAWNLPADLGDIAAHHHEPTDDAGKATLSIHRGCLLADALGFSVAPYASRPSYEEALALFSESERALLPGEAEDLASEIRRELSFIEVW